MISCILLISMMLSTAPGTPGRLPAIQMARTEFEAGNYSAAVQTLTAALSEAPQDSSLHYWALRSYYELQDYENAVTFGEKAVKLDPQNAEYNRWLGRAYGDKQKAREQIEAISKIDPIEGHLARGAYFAADKKWKEAEAEYVAVLDAPPHAIDDYMEAAQFFVDRKDAQQIERAVEAARSIDSKDPRLDYYKAVSLILRRSDTPTAEKLLKSYVANVPQRSDYPSHNSAREWLSRNGK